MTRLFLIVLAVLGIALTAGSSLPGGEVRAQAAEILVTSTSDATGSEIECPGEGNCTLRKAIETANATPGEGEVRVAFDAVTFPPSTVTRIEVEATPLPTVTRANVTIDGAGVVAIDGDALDGEADGLRLDGDNASLRGLTLVNFEGACTLVTGDGASIGGDRTTGGGNRFAGCETGLRISGTGAAVRGNIFGFADGQALPVTVAMEVGGGMTTIGGIDLAPALANVIGHAVDGIVVNGVEGTLIAGNRFGLDEAGTVAAPLERGVVVIPAAKGTRVTQNLFANAASAAVALPEAAAGEQSAGTTIRDNEFRMLAGLEIDLRGDALRNPNDPDDADSGPSTGLNHPVITRPTQSAIDGLACAGCTIELYRAEHSPGGEGDFAAVLVSTTVAGPTGAFSFASPPVAPGEWVTASATDAAGNTSEFGQPVRVGAGAIQCGNIGLLAGWNHAGYFGASTVLLGEAFPGDPSGAVRAVYELGPDGSYRHWFRDTPVGRTLTSLVPGRAYWFLVDAPLVLQEGFSLTAPLGVTLTEGLNSFVYFGASGDVRDAFASLLDAGIELWEWVADASGGAWSTWGTEDTPGWAREFETAQACHSYMVWVDDDAVLSPLHP
jgi:hypothetical protein